MIIDKKLRLKIEIKNNEYVIGTLRLNKKSELYYLMDRPKGLTNSCLNLNMNTFTTPIKKISFHTNATHIKITTVSDKKEKTLGKINNILLPPNNEIKILYVESLILNGTPELVLPTVVDWKADSEFLIASMDEINNFSLIFILVPKNISTDDLFLFSKVAFRGMEIDFVKFKNPKHNIERIQAFKNYDIVIFTTPYAAKIVNNPINGPVRLMNYEAPVESLAKISQEFEEKNT